MARRADRESMSDIAFAALLTKKMRDRGWIKEGPDHADYRNITGSYGRWESGDDPVVALDKPQQTRQTFFGRY